MRYQRQVDRAFNMGHAPAREQIESAWVLHVDVMIRHIKYYTKGFLTLKCSVCGKRHFFHPYKEYSDMYQMHCDYGWWRCISGIWVGAKFHLLHGEDR